MQWCLNIIKKTYYSNVLVHAFFIIYVVITVVLRSSSYCLYYLLYIWQPVCIFIIIFLFILYYCITACD